MIVDAVVQIKNIDRNIKRIEVRSPKYPKGEMLIALPMKYEHKKIKLFTDKNDIVTKIPILSYNTIIEIGDFVYIYIAEQFIK